MHEPLEHLIDRSRQRHFTDDEISGIAGHARRLATGCAVIERLRALETQLVQSAISKTTQRFPDLESTLPEAADMLEQSLLMMVRQAAFGMAVDDYSRLCDFLCDLQQFYWTSGVSGMVIEFATAALRDEAMTTIDGQAGKAFDEWLEVGARFVTVTTEVGTKRSDILEDALSTLFNRFSDLEDRYVDCRSKTARDFELVLLHSIRGMLPDGELRVFRMLRTFHDAIKQAKFGAAFMEEAFEILADVCRRHLDPGRSVELFVQLPSVIDFITLSADLGDHSEDIINKSVEALYQLHSEQQPTQEHVEKARRDESLILEHCVYATHPGGQDELVRLMASFSGTLNRFNFGSRLIADAYKMLHETCRTTLRARSRAALLPVLHRTAHFLAIASDLAEKKDAMLASVADQLEEKYPAYFSQNPDGKMYAVRDQEQLLFNLALGLLPGGTEGVVGRFASFGEVILQGRLDAQLLLDSFRMLEAACMETLEPQSLALLIPSWHKVQKYLETCVELASCETQIVSDATRAVQLRFAADLKHFDNGVERTSRDIRALLRTVVLSAIPGGERHLVRGLSLFMDSIVSTTMPRAMLDAAFGGLVKAAKIRLSPVQREWLVPILERCRSFIHAAADIGEDLDSIVASVLDTVFAHQPQQVDRYPGAQRKGAKDLELAVRHSVLAIVPGGDSDLASRLWKFSEVIFAQQFGAQFLTDAYRELRQKVWVRLDTVSLKAFEPLLDGTINSITLLAELAERAEPIMNECIDALYHKYPESQETFRASREKTMRDMECVLRCGALAAAPGGEEILVQRLQMFAEILLDGRFGAQLMWDAYDGLARSADTHLHHPAKQVLITAVEAARDYIALMAGLADKEEAILTDCVEELFDTRATQMHGYQHAREKTEHDQRVLLRSSALSLLPGGQQQHREIVELMRTVTQRAKFDHGLILDGYGLLQKNCEKHLQVGPVQQLTRVLDESAQEFIV